MNEAPAISVILPVYNGQAYLADAVESILSQSFGDFELIAIDDGSSDGSLAILNGYDDPKMRIISRENRGLIATLNEGLALARAPLVARMDADDVALPDRFEKQLAYLHTNPEVALLGGGVTLIDGAGKEGRSIIHPTLPELVKSELRIHNVMAHPTVMARKDALLEAGGYRAAYLHAEDYDLWLRLAERHGVANMADVLLLYRQHSNKVSVKGYPQQLISTIVARRAAQWRAEGHAEPQMVLANLDSLSALGAGPEEVRREYGACLAALFAATAGGAYPVAALRSDWRQASKKVWLERGQLHFMLYSLLVAGRRYPRELPGAAWLLLAMMQAYPTDAMRCLIATLRQRLVSRVRKMLKR